MLRYVPIVGRMDFRDYLRLVITFIILITEPIFRFFVRLLPDICTRKSKDDQKFSMKSSTADFIESCGFKCSDHFVTTKDGYILGIHRITNQVQSNTGGSEPSTLPPVLLWHGFLMSSEVWVCSPDPKMSLALTLSKAGYDVWLGNTRGNKYSAKHIKLKQSQSRFWDFSFDQVALDDVPSTVDYILKTTNHSSLTYIGFSQGTAQAFAGLSFSQELNQKINLFVALAPVTKPIGLENQGFNALVKTSPDIIYLLFGRKCLMSVILFWQKIVPPAIWAAMIEYAIYFIFNWDSKHLLYKENNFRHLYSYSSVKCVVHWFQIISSQRFQVC
jgi:lysosomal acid lipase/cholesteryl ester hydrolase